MTFSLRDDLSLHSAALMLRERRNEVLTSNIANAATPNYKARDIDFTAELGRFIAQDEQGSANPAAGPADDKLLYRVPVSPSLDGNTVDLSVEQMQFAENTMHYQASLTLLNRRISGLMSAIKGE